jgi:hypothetical protein
VEAWQVTYHFQDNNGKVAQARVHVGSALAFPTVVSIAESLASRLEVISSAALAGFNLYRKYSRPEAEPAAAGSDVEAFVLLFYGNITEAATLIVPSPGRMPADVVGPYRDVRLDLAADGVSDLLTQVGLHLGSTLTPDRNPWPGPLLAGGFTRYQGE